MLNGVGVVATKRRNISLSHKYDGYFPKPTHTDPLLAENGTNNHTIEEFIPMIVKNYSYQTEKIADVLKRDTLEETCRAIFDFVYSNIQYKPDSPFEEQIRQPARSWADRISGVDCDCYTTFISSILTNLRIPHYIRMAAYSASRGYQHIYVIVPKNPEIPTNTNYFTIDPVLDRFNDEKKPILKKHDKLMQPVKALNIGVNGFPIRMLNGGVRLKSDLVYDDIYYSPELGTWALKGLDGGFYIEGDPNRRVVEALNGRFWKKLAKVAAPLAKTALKIVAPRAANLLEMGGKLVSKAKGAASSVVESVQNAPVAQAAQAFSSSPIAKAAMALPMAQAAQAFSSSPIAQALPQFEAKLQSVNNNTVRAIDTLKKGNDEKLTQLNKSTVISLQSLDKGTKEQIANLSKEVGAKVEKLATQGESAKEAAKAIIMNTATINKKAEERATEMVVIMQDNAKQQQAQAGKAANTQKYLLVAVAGLALFVLFNTLSNKQKSNIN